MKPSSSPSNTALPLSALAGQLNLKHPLVQLAETIEWQSFEEKFGRVVKASGGRPALSTPSVTTIDETAKERSINNCRILRNGSVIPFGQVFVKDNF